jgi:hypothetical protein
MTGSLSQTPESVTIQGKKAEQFELPSTVSYLPREKLSIAAFAFSGPSLSRPNRHEYKPIVKEHL